MCLNDRGMATIAGECLQGMLGIPWVVIKFGGAKVNSAAYLLGASI